MSIKDRAWISYFLLYINDITYTTGLGFHLLLLLLLVIRYFLLVARYFLLTVDNYCTHLFYNNDNDNSIYFFVCFLDYIKI